MHRAIFSAALFDASSNEHVVLVKFLIEDGRACLTARENGAMRQAIAFKNATIFKLLFEHASVKEQMDDEMIHAALKMYLNEEIRDDLKSMEKRKVRRKVLSPPRSGGN